MAVTLTYREQLIALFAGELEDGDYLTAPCPTVPLALEICKVADPGSFVKLREAVYGPAMPADMLPDGHLAILQHGYDRWRSIRHQHKGTRGL